MSDWSTSDEEFIPDDDVSVGMEEGEESDEESEEEDEEGEDGDAEEGGLISDADKANRDTVVHGQAGALLPPSTPGTLSASNKRTNEEAGDTPPAATHQPQPIDAIIPSNLPLRSRLRTNLNLQGYNLDELDDILRPSLPQEEALHEVCNADYADFITALQGYDDISGFNSALDEDDDEEFVPEEPEKDRTDGYNNTNDDETNEAHTQSVSLSELHGLLFASEEESRGSSWSSSSSEASPSSKVPAMDMPKRKFCSISRESRLTASSIKDRTHSRLLSQMIPGSHIFIEEDNRIVFNEAMFVKLKEQIRYYVQILIQNLVLASQSSEYEEVFETILTLLSDLLVKRNEANEFRRCAILPSEEVLNELDRPRVTRRVLDDAVSRSFRPTGVDIRSVYNIPHFHILGETLKNLDDFRSVTNPVIPEAVNGAPMSEFYVKKALVSKQKNYIKFTDFNLQLMKEYHPLFFQSLFPAEATEHASSKSGKGRQRFSASDDMLLRHGLFKYTFGDLKSIQSEILPTKSCRQIFFRVKNMSVKKGLEVNPIRDWKEIQTEYKKRSVDTMHKQTQMEPPEFRPDEKEMLMQAVSKYSYNFVKVHETLFPHYGPELLRLKWIETNTEKLVHKSTRITLRALRLIENPHYIPSETENYGKGKDDDDDGQVVYSFKTERTGLEVAIEIMNPLLADDTTAAAGDEGDPYLPKHVNWPGLYNDVYVPVEDYGGGFDGGGFERSRFEDPNGTFLAPPPPPPRPVPVSVHAGTFNVDLNSSMMSQFFNDCSILMQGDNRGGPTSGGNHVSSNNQHAAGDESLCSFGNTNRGSDITSRVDIGSTQALQQHSSSRPPVTGGDISLFSFISGGGRGGSGASGSQMRPAVTGGDVSLFSFINSGEPVGTNRAINVPALHSCPEARPSIVAETSLFSFLTNDKDVSLRCPPPPPVPLATDVKPPSTRNEMSLFSFIGATSTGNGTVQASLPLTAVKPSFSGVIGCSSATITASHRQDMLSGPPGELASIQAVGPPVALQDQSLFSFISAGDGISPSVPNIPRVQPAPDASCRGAGVSPPHTRGRESSNPMTMNTEHSLFSFLTSDASTTVTETIVETRGKAGKPPSYAPKTSRKRKAVDKDGGGKQKGDDTAAVVVSRPSKKKKSAAASSVQLEPAPPTEWHLDLPAIHNVNDGFYNLPRHSGNSTACIEHCENSLFGGVLEAASSAVKHSTGEVEMRPLAVDPSNDMNSIFQQLGGDSVPSSTRIVHPLPSSTVNKNQRETSSTNICNAENSLFALLQDSAPPQPVNAMSLSAGTAAGEFGSLMNILDAVPPSSHKGEESLAILLGASLPSSTDRPAAENAGGGNPCTLSPNTGGNANDDCGRGSSESPQTPITFGARGGGVATASQNNPLASDKAIPSSLLAESSPSLGGLCSGGGHFSHIGKMSNSNGCSPFHSSGDNSHRQPGAGLGLGVGVGSVPSSPSVVNQRRIVNAVSGSSPAATNNSSGTADNIMMKLDGKVLRWTKEEDKEILIELLRNKENANVERIWASYVNKGVIDADGKTCDDYKRRGDWLFQSFLKNKKA